MHAMMVWGAQRAARERHFRDCTSKCLVKVSGDVFLQSSFLDWVAELARTNKVVISIGGGTQINQRLEEHGIKSEKHPRVGRETSKEGYAHALKVLKENQAFVRKGLQERNAIAYVVLPIITIAGEDCHVDGDVVVLNAYLGYDKLYVVTTPDRVETKRELFRDLPKVQVISL